MTVDAETDEAIGLAGSNLEKKFEGNKSGYWGNLFSDNIYGTEETGFKTSGLFGERDVSGQDFRNNNDYAGFNEYLKTQGAEPVSMEVFNKMGKTGYDSLSVMDMGELGLAGVNLYQDLFGRGKDMFELQEKSINANILDNKKNMTAMQDQLYYGGSDAQQDNNAYYSKDGVQGKKKAGITKNDAVAMSLSSAMA